MIPDKWTDVIMREIGWRKAEILGRKERTALGLPEPERAKE